MQPLKTKGSERITHHNENLDRYFEQLSKYKVLTAKEEFELITTDPNWREKIVLHNLSFVLSVANKYNPKTPTMFQELIEVGNEGLILASKKFDHTRGFKFISYAVWWIDQKIMEYLSGEHKLIKLPSNVAGLELKIIKLMSVTEDFEMLSNDEILGMLEDLYPKGQGATLDNIQRLRNYGYKPFSLNDYVVNGEGESIEYIETLRAEDNFVDFHSEEVLEEYLKRTLNPVNYNVLISCLGLFGSKEKTYKELSLDLGVTPERVRQLLKKTILLLKRNKKLKDFLCLHL